jgi:hypothetical protein
MDTTKTQINKLPKRTVIIALVSVATLILLSGAAMLAHNMIANSSIKSKQYQAVFLTNGQVYFGKLSDIDQPYVKLTSVYYPLAQSAQSGSSSAGSSSAGNLGTSQLVKLGGEVHAPEDQMNIAKAQILFWENIKDDGQVVQLIKAKKK